nr:hypothetical protein [Candidatus Paceibacterota bacterium]
ESMLHPEKTLENLQSLREFIELGLSFDDDYEVTKLDHYIELVDFVQVMGIDEIGKQGEPFEPRSLYNIAYLRNKFPDMPISVDGAVNAETIQKFKEAGATRFVTGSAIFQGDAKDNIKYLESLLWE